MDVLNIVIRIFMAVLIGGFIGYEREMKNRPAGFVTHTLVCVGACVVSLIQVQMVSDTILIINENPVMASALKADIGRIVAQVITGVGFLGAGTIVFDKGSVKGLTTATTLWVVACIGLAIGLGYYKIAMVSGVSIIFIIIVLKRIEVYLKNKRLLRVLEIGYKSDAIDFIENIVKFLKKQKVQVRDLKFLESEDIGIKKCRFIIYLGVSSKHKQIVGKLAANDDIIYITQK